MNRQDATLNSENCFRPFIRGIGGVYLSTSIPLAEEKLLSQFNLYGQPHSVEKGSIGFTIARTPGTQLPS